MKFFQLLVNVTLGGTNFDIFDVVCSPDEMPEDICYSLVERGFAKEVIVIEE